MTRRRGQQEQAERFLAVSPRPKLRGRSEPRPGASKSPSSILHVTEDRERGLALIRGKNVRAILELANADEGSRWSPSAKGYVVSSGVLADVLAMADYANAPWRIKQVQADA